MKSTSAVAAALLLALVLIVGALLAQRSLCRDLRRHHADSGIGNPACSPPR